MKEDINKKQNVISSDMQKPKKSLLYIEAICYAIVIILVILLNNFGIIYIKMVPLLFLLGIAGNLVFDRPVITSLFGGIVSFCILYIQSVTDIKSNLISSVFVALFIGMGETLGDLIELIYYDIKKQKVLSKKKKILVYIAIAIFIAGPLLLNGYVNGDIFGYLKAKNELNRYIISEYNNENQFKIVSSDYAYMNYKGYIFNVKNISLSDVQNNVYTFIVYLNNNNIQDGYKQKLIEENNNVIHSDLDDFLTKQDFSKNYQEYSIAIECEYPDTVKLKISESVDKLDDNQIQIFSKDVINILKTFKNFRDYDKITQASIALKQNEKKNLKATLDKKYFDSDYTFVINSLKEEYLKD